MGSINGLNSQRRKRPGTRKKRWHTQDDLIRRWSPPARIIPFTTETVLLDDDFSSDTGLFTGSNPANPVISGGVMTSAPTTSFYHKATPFQYDLWGKAAEFLNVSNMFDGSVSSAAWWARVTPVSGDAQRLQWDTFVSGGVVQLRAGRVNAANSTTAVATLTYNAATHRDLRIRHNRNTGLIYWEYRGSGTNERWVSAGSYSADLWSYDLTNVALNIGSGLSAGTASSNPTVGGVRIGPPAGFYDERNLDSGSSPWGFDTLSGAAGIITLATSGQLFGAGCLDIASNGTQTARLRYNAGVVPVDRPMYFRFYVYLFAAPSGTAYIMKRAATGGSANLVQIAISITPTITMRDHTGTAQGGSLAFPLNQWVRIEGMHDPTTSRMRMKVWTTHSSTGTPDFDTGDQVTIGDPDLWTAVGQDNTSTTSHFLIDEWALSDAGWIGPFVAAGVGNPYRRVAGAWDKTQALQRKVGGVFSGFNLKRRNAGVWEDI